MSPTTLASSGDTPAASGFNEPRQYGEELPVSPDQLLDLDVSISRRGVFAKIVEHCTELPMIEARTCRMLLHDVANATATSAQSQYHLGLLKKFGQPSELHSRFVWSWCVL